MSEIDKLTDCRDHGLDSGSELLIVEGDSAADSVVALRHAEWQAVLAMQGKPMNAAKASKARVGKSPPMRRLIDSIGAGWADEFDLTASRYSRVVILCDPDIDGVHARSLLLLFFNRWMRPLLDEGMIFTARPPLWRITSASFPEGEVRYAWSDPHFAEVERELDEAGIYGRTPERFRGLGNMPPDVLHETCLDPKRRTLVRLTTEHADAALRSFEQMRAQLKPRPAG